MYILLDFCHCLLWSFCFLFLGQELGEGWAATGNIYGYIIYGTGGKELHFIYISF